MPKTRSVSGLPLAFCQKLFENTLLEERHADFRQLGVMRKVPGLAAGENVDQQCALSVNADA